MFPKKQKQPEEVFTPRSANVNEDMYVSRGVLEDRLRDALKGNKYIIVHGDSGNGKTWLYKKVLSEDGFEFTTISLSNAKLYGSISAAIEDKLGSLGYKEDTETETTTKGSLGYSTTNVARESKVKEIIQAKGSFTRLVEFLRRRAGKAPAALVFDNFEQIMDDDELLGQLRALVISADDDEIARYGVKVLIVGVPGNLKDLIAKTSGATPIINRITEIPEVDRIEPGDAKALIQKGLFKELRYEARGLEADQICDAVAFFTDGIAQQIHDYALHISQESERNERVIDQAVMNVATRNWVTSTLSADWAVIEAAMNSRRTEVGRKNQTLFCIARAKSSEF